MVFLKYTEMSAGKSNLFSLRFVKQDRELKGYVKTPLIFTY